MASHSDILVARAATDQKTINELPDAETAQGYQLEHASYDVAYKEAVNT